MTTSELAEIVKLNGLDLSDQTLRKIEQYAELLRETNQVVNLISRKDEENILSKHILHSLTLTMPLLHHAGIPNNAWVFDLGTGGGLPGIPLKIIRDDLRVVLCDSIAKKVVAVGEMVQKLGLQNCLAITARGESLSSQNAHRKKYDVVVTRAVAPLVGLLTWSQDLLKRGGVLLALKGGNLDAEIAEASKLRFVKSIKEQPLTLNGYAEFATEEKKIVRVELV
ncbi:MAG: 16S rRNA (guanine(527)-N(7))-methyltransferase RsmG [bacterium]